jgi:hypothetical protein
MSLDFGRMLYLFSLLVYHFVSAVAELLSYLLGSMSLQLRERKRQYTLLDWELEFQIWTETSETNIRAEHPPIRDPRKAPVIRTWDRI